MTVADELDEVVKALEGIRPRYVRETDVQNAIAEAFTAKLIPFLREAELSTRANRPDFRTGRDEHSIAVEVKIDGGVADVERQIGRYLSDETITGCVLVTTRFRHSAIVRTLCGKPIRVVVIAAGLL